MKLIDTNSCIENIIQPELIINANNSAVIISTLTHCKLIHQLSTQMGFAKIFMYYDITCLLPPELQELPNYFWINTFKGMRKHLLENKHTYSNLFNLLQDELSRECF